MEQCFFLPHFVQAVEPNEGVETRQNRYAPECKKGPATVHVLVLVVLFYRTELGRGLFYRREGGKAGEGEGFGRGRKSGSNTVTSYHTACGGDA